MADYKYNKPYSLPWNGVHSKYEITPDFTKPLPPRNIFVTSPYLTGMLDIRWDSPLDIAENSKWHILGVNVYRSEDSEAGPYEKINTNPIETFFYRDNTINKLVVDEDVTPHLKFGENTRGDWVFTTQHFPIVKQNSQNEILEDPRGLVVKIDNNDGLGAITVPIVRINAAKGEVYLITQSIYNPETKKIDDPILPTNPNSKVYCTYWYNVSLIRSDLIPRFFYKVTVIGQDNFGNISETSLDKVIPANVHQLEKPHYIWRSVIVKNRFLLEQFGERVKLFIRKEVGEKCPNYTETHKQAQYFCPICYGTGIRGGFYGPVDIMIAPPEAEKKIDLTDVGLRLNFTFESWMGPTPMIRPRDFVVRQNGERLIVGGVTPQGAKGSIFQQHFSLNYRDSKDIIYQVSIYGDAPKESCKIAYNKEVPVVDDTRGVNQPITDASPVIPDYKSERAKTEKGRTIDFENVTW